MARECSGAGHVIGRLDGSFEYIQFRGEPATLSLNSALSSDLAGALTNQIQGEGTLAGQAALARVNNAITNKQSAANPSAAPAAGSSSGYAVVQNLMSSLDNITIENGNAPTAGVSSSAAASGYSAVQNLMNSLDNITINGSSSRQSARADRSRSAPERRCDHRPAAARQCAGIGSVSPSQTVVVELENVSNPVAAGYAGVRLAHVPMRSNQTRRRHARACRGHPRLSCGVPASKAWMAGTSPAMTSEEVVQHDRDAL